MSKSWIVTGFVVVFLQACGGGGDDTVAEIKYDQEQAAGVVQGHGSNIQAIRLLREPPFAPLDINMLTTQAYPQAVPMVPAAAYPINEFDLRWKVAATLAKRFPGNPREVLAGVALMDDPVIKTKIPDAQLRAALAMLKGSAGAQAIDAVKNNSYLISVGFGDPRSGELTIAEAHVEDGTIVFNQRYKFEDPRLLGTTMFHEALHQDLVDPNREELMNNGLDALIYGQFIQEDRSLARQGTELTRRYNTKLTSLLNSRDVNGRIHFLQAQSNVLPGASIPLPYFAYGFVNGGLGDAAPGNAVLSYAVQKVTGKSIINAQFDEATLNLLDQNINLFSPAQWVAIARALKLDVGS